MTKLEKGRVLKVDEKWSITYDPDNNDRPLKLFRYDVDINVDMHDEKNYVLAMFYRILELENMKAQAEHIAELEAENEKLRKGFDVYQRERDRYKHATPEMSGAYFLSGGHGPKDDNQMPQFVEIVPAYGCGWSMIYEDTGRSISYEGS
jgi:hypothetical protein